MTTEQSAFFTAQKYFFIKQPNCFFKSKTNC